jgi:hypothetical protein
VRAVECLAAAPVSRFSSAVIAVEGVVTVCTPDFSIEVSLLFGVVLNFSAGKKNKPHKYKDEPIAYSPQQGYQAPAPMMGGGLASPPQFATFEVGKNGLAIDKPAAIHEDALPPMPSWDTAAKKHVLSADEKNAVELGELDPATGQQVPLMTGGGGTSLPPSPIHDMGHNQYGVQPGQSGADGYMSVGGGDSYGQNQPAYNQHAYDQNAGGYRGPSRGAPAVGGRPYMSPAGSYGPSQDGSGRGYTESDYGSSRGYAPSQAGSGPGYAPSAAGSGRGYGPPTPQDRYGSNNKFPGNGYERQGPQRQGFPSQPTRQYSGNSMNQRPDMQRQYTDQSYMSGEYQQNTPPPRGPSRGPSRGPGTPAPINNNSGFDFGGSRQDSYPSQTAPQQQSYNSNYQGSTAPPSYATRSPPPQEQNYRTYGQGGRAAPQALIPGGGRSREPQAWDPVQR